MEKSVSEDERAWFISRKGGESEDGDRVSFPRWGKRNVVSFHFTELILKISEIEMLTFSYFFLPINSNINYNKQQEKTMKKSIILCILTIGLLTLQPSLSFSQSAEDILEKMIDAQGGRIALEKIQDTVLTGYMEMVQMGLGGSLKTYQKEPNKLRMDATVQGAVVIQSFDGETAWMTNPMTGLPEEMPLVMSEDFGRSALGNGALLDPGKFGITYILTGKELLEGKEYFVLSQNFSDGFKAIFLIDPETYLMYKTKTTSKNEVGKEVDVETVFTDYKNIEGILVAHTLITYQDGREFMKMTITKVEFNTGLEDTWFNLK